MTSATDTAHPTDGPSADLELDAVVLGAGVAGLYQLHQLREQGLPVRAYEAGTDMGGTWYWNRYPGARFDSEAYSYQYLYSEELYKDWSWREKFSGRPEIEQWLHYVTDRLNLRDGGMLSAPMDDMFEGQDTFRGPIFHTPTGHARRTWPGSASASSGSGPPTSRSSKPSPTRSTT